MTDKVNISEYLRPAATKTKGDSGEKDAWLGEELEHRSEGQVPPGYYTYEASKGLRKRES
jgi:hypothetical protein